MGGSSNRAPGHQHETDSKSSIEAPPPSHSAIEVVPVPGKGLGTRALRDIAQGEVILEEEPLLCVDLAGAECSDDFERCVREAAASLSQRAREELLGLACATAEPTPEGVFQVNHFEVDGACVLYRRISRLNHSCRPSCAHSFDRQRGVGQIRTLRNVLAGEELSLTYTELRIPREARQRHLASFYGFWCTCEACSEGGLCSDERRELLKQCCDVLSARGPLVQVHNFAENAREWSEPARAKLLSEAFEARELGLRVANLALRLLHEEELLGAADSASHACEAAAFLLAGHPAAQTLWIEKSLQFMALGGSASDVEGMRRGLDNLRQFPRLLPEMEEPVGPCDGVCEEGGTIEAARSCLQRCMELFDCSVAANAP